MCLTCITWTKGKYLRRTPYVLYLTWNVPSRNPPGFCRNWPNGFDGYRPVPTLRLLYGEERAQGLRDALSRFAQTAVRRWPDLPADWGAQQDSSLEALEMMGQQVDTRYPTLRQEGLREGLREAQLEYVEERYGVAARQAVADFLDSLATDEKVSFADLDGLVEAWHDGSDLPSWWRNH